MNNQKLLEALGWLGCTKGTWCANHESYKPTGWEFCSYQIDNLDSAEQGYDVAIRQMKNSLLDALSKMHSQQVESLDKATSANEMKNILGTLTGIVWSQNVIKDWKAEE